jgi:hypothetical protein
MNANMPANRRKGRAKTEMHAPRASQMIRPWQVRSRTLQFEPNVSGLNLIEKACGARTARGVLCVVIPIVMWQLCLAARINAQEVAGSPSGLRVVPSDSVAGSRAVVVSAPHAIRPHATAVSIHGKCDYSADGITFTNLESGHLLEQGAVIRTGEDGWTDLFFRRTGITVRLQVGTEIRLDQMVVSVRDGSPALHILLGLRTGRILTVVRSTGGGSTLEIENAAGRSVVEGNRIGRYIITADGAQVSDKVSAVPLKLIGEKGITFIAAGEQFTKQDGKTLSVTSNLFVHDLAQLDELQKVAEKSVPKERSSESISANGSSNAPASQFPSDSLSDRR